MLTVWSPSRTLFSTALRSRPHGETSCVCVSEPGSLEFKGICQPLVCHKSAQVTLDNGTPGDNVLENTARIVPKSSETDITTGELQFRRRNLLSLASACLGLATLGNASVAQPALANVSASATFQPLSFTLGDAGQSLPLSLTDSFRESRIYDATVLGEPMAIHDKERAWKRLLNARVVYLGEVESISDPTDKVLELEIIRKLRDECLTQLRPVTVAFSGFPRPLQKQLELYQENRLADEELKEYVLHWPAGRWEEFLPVLHYCRDNGVQLYACGVPPEVLRTVQARGVQALSVTNRKIYAPTGGLIFGKGLPPLELDGVPMVDGLPNPSQPFSPGPYRFAQARILEDYTMAQTVGQVMAEQSPVGMLIVIAGTSHVSYGARGRGVPARVARKLFKSSQAIVLLNSERQQFRVEGELPVADFLWYSGAKACKRNCFDRAELARVMGAARKSRETLPQDLQVGLEKGLVSPETLRAFLDLESQPIIAEATKRFQGLRERWLADPRFLQRLCVEELISLTTTLIAQYQKRRERFWSELDYVITDTTRGAVVDFFTVWLPAPTLSFRAMENTAASGSVLVDGLKGLLGSFPDNAFQRASQGENWGLHERIAAVLVGGVKLFGVGFVSSIGTVGLSNLFVSFKQNLNPAGAVTVRNQRPPVVKTALVYGSFLGVSANLRYQAISGIVEHWIADYILFSHPLAGTALSFAARTANSFWGTGQWIDLARRAGLQVHKVEDFRPDTLDKQPVSPDSESLSTVDIDVLSSTAEVDKEVTPR